MNPTEGKSCFKILINIFFGIHTFGMRTFGMHTFGMRTFGMRTFGMLTFVKRTFGKYQFIREFKVPLILYRRSSFNTVFWDSEKPC